MVKGVISVEPAGPDRGAVHAQRAASHERRASPGQRAFSKTALISGARGSWRVRACPISTRSKSERQSKGREREREGKRKREKKKASFGRLEGMTRTYVPFGHYDASAEIRVHVRYGLAKLISCDTEALCRPSFCLGLWSGGWRSGRAKWVIFISFYSTVVSSICTLLCGWLVYPNDDDVTHVRVALFYLHSTASAVRKPTSGRYAIVGCELIYVYYPRRACSCWSSGLLPHCSFVR